jgi:ATP-dependent RNA helicase DeaD
MKEFKPFGLSSFLTKALENKRITEPTAIQKEAIPPILAGNDVLAQSQTGSGKTLAFLLPLLQRLNAERAELQVLILSPTRELTMQTAKEVESLIEGTSIQSVALVGGTDIQRQIQRLKKHPQVIVGTPGRVLDLILRKKVNAHTVKALVIDEADQMLDMGFMKEMEKIIRSTKRDRQLCLFSATLPKGIIELAENLMKQPVKIHIRPQEKVAKEIEHVYFLAKDRDKDEVVCQLARLYQPYLGLIFTNTKDRAQILSMIMARRGFNVDVLHGDMPQQARKQVMARFREAKIQFLVATDIAARGLDVEGVSHVINYEIPRDQEQYIHRVGRTGRAGESGLAVSVVTPSELHRLRQWPVKHLLKRKQIIDDAITDANDRSDRFTTDEYVPRPKRKPDGRSSSGRDYAKGRSGSYSRSNADGRENANGRGNAGGRSYGKANGKGNTEGRSNANGGGNASGRGNANANGKRYDAKPPARGKRTGASQPANGNRGARGGSRGKPTKGR